MKNSFQASTPATIDGHFLVTFRDDHRGEGMDVLREQANVADFAHASDFADRAIPHHLHHGLTDGQGAMFDDLNICSVCCAPEAAQRIADVAHRSAILAIEPLHTFHALQQLAVTEPSEFLDSATESWAYLATGRKACPQTGAGVKVAVLDTGSDLSHPDLQAVTIVHQRSFVSGDVTDRHGHGSFCLGAIAGPEVPSHAPSYSFAPNAQIIVGKVLRDDGLGDVGGVLAGLNWAVAQQSDVVSLSIGADLPGASVALEEASRRAVQNGTLVVAAAGNNADRALQQFGHVVRPANCRYVMAVGGLDRRLQIAGFSSRASMVAGGEVDLAAPGVEVFGCWPGAETYRSLSGTSMATPIVAGIAALHAEHTGARGRALWDQLMETAQPLLLPKVDVGAGLVQAPQG